MNRLNLYTTICLAVATSLGGCGDGELEYMPMDLPAVSCDTGSADTDAENCAETGTDGLSDTTGAGLGATTAQMGSSGSGDADECQLSEDCMGGVCAGGFDPEAETRTPYLCSFTCIADLDDASWCSDDAACCTEGSTCGTRGYCVPAAGGG